VPPVDHLTVLRSAHTVHLSAFFMDPGTNSDYFPLQHKQNDFYNKYLTLCSPVVTICTTSLTLNNSTFCPRSVCVFFMDIRIVSDYFPIRHKHAGFYIRGGVCGSLVIIQINIWFKE
jgi:hypothetical protein